MSGGASTRFRGWARAIFAAMVLSCSADEVAEERGGAGPIDVEILPVGSVNLVEEDPDKGVFWGELPLVVSDDASGVSVVAELPGGGTPSDLIIIDKVTRGDTVVRDFWNDPTGPQRGEPLEALFALQYPTSELVDFAPGDHTIRVASTGRFTGVTVTQQVQRGAVASGLVDFKIYLAGVAGLSAANAMTHAGFTAMWAEATSLLAKAGLSVGVVAFVDVVDESLFEVDGPSSAPGTSLGRLFALSGAYPGRHLNLFLVKALSEKTGAPLLGIAGGVPGPGQMTGTVHSGIVANTEDLENDPALVAQAAAHEILHYLGLFHTSERSFASGQSGPCLDVNRYDPIADTPQCGPEQDTNGNCEVDAQECAANGSNNLMFWAGVKSGTDAEVTPGQSYVLRRNPIVR